AGTRLRWRDCYASGAIRRLPRLIAERLAGSDVAAEDGFDGSSAHPGCGVACVEGFFVDGAGVGDGVDGVVDVGVGEGGGDDEGGADDAAGEELAEEEGAVGLGGFAVGVEGGEDEVGGAAADLEVVGDAEVG